MSQDLCNKYSEVFSLDLCWGNPDEHGNKNVGNNYFCKQDISFTSASQFSVTLMRPFMDDVNTFGRFILSLF